MWKSIDLKKIDELLKEYKDFGFEDETFCKFIERTSDDNIPVWDLTDSIGVVTKQDFENNFSKEYIEENFEDLASEWFKGLNAQVDYGIVLECIEEEINYKDKK